MYKLICLRSKKEFLIEEKESLILGRGEEYACVDKRVSRKHAELRHSDDGGPLLTALHANPCFIMRQGSPPVIIVKKDEKIELKNGDYMALLPDSSWFEIFQSPMSDGECPSSPCFLSDPSKSPFLNKLSDELDVKSRNHNAIEDRENNDTFRDDVNINVEGNDCPTPSDIGSPKSDFEENTSVIPSTSILSDIQSTKYEGEDCPTPSDVGSPKSDVHEKTTPPSSPTCRTNEVSPLSAQKTTKEDNTARNFDPSSSSHPSKSSKSRKLPLWMYAIDGDGPSSKRPALISEQKSLNMTTEESSTHKETLKLNETSKGSSPGNLQENSREPKESSSKLSNQTILMTSTDNINGPLIAKTEPSSSEKTNQPFSDSDTGLTAVKVEVGETQSSNDSSSVAAPASSSRPLCQYEGSCYRKNIQHRQMFCHPGDADWTPPDQRPPCPFGSTCYRQNRSHRVEFHHPPSGRRRRRTPSPSSSYDDDEELDSIEDPFHTDDDSGDSDWNPGGDASQRSLEE